MFKTEVKQALVDYTYDRIQQKNGVVRIDFLCTILTRDKEGMKEALKELITPYSCRDIYVSLEEINGYTYMFVHKGDKLQRKPSIFFKGF